MRLRNAVGSALVIAMVFAGCAPYASRAASSDTKRCSEEPRMTVMRVIEAILEVNWALIRMLIPDGMSIRSVFGGGDERRGIEVARQLWNHPEALDDQSDAVIQDLRVIDFAKLGNGESRVVLEREDLVTRFTDRHREAVAGEASQTYRQDFAVRFQADTNCVTAIRPLEPHWRRIR